MDGSQIPYPEEAVMDDVGPAAESPYPARSPRPMSPRPLKTRSLSDGGSTTKLSPSPHIIEAARRTSKDDTSLHNVTPAPVTPLRNNFALRSLSLQTTSIRDFASGSGTSISSTAFIRPGGGVGGGGVGGGALSGSRGGANLLTHQQSQGQQQQHQSGSVININTSGAFTTTGSVAPLSSSTTTTSTTPSAPAGFLKPTTTPISPKLDQSQIYASPTNILPRRSRGLDFSRAATSLHHSTLADQASPDSSPTIGAGRSAMNIPGRRDAAFGLEQSSSSLWSIMGGTPGTHNPSGHGIGANNHNNTAHISSSLGSVNMMASESSSSSDEDDFMDDDMDEAFVTTPQVAKTGTPIGHNHPSGGVPWMAGAPVGSPCPGPLNSLAFQRPQRRIKQPKKKLHKAGPLGLGLSAAAAGLSKSPPNNFMVKDMPHTRRESISWAANQLHISSGNDSDENSTNSRQAGGGDGPAAMDADGLPVTPARPNVIRRTVTRRQNLLPKTKGFARIKAELIEESAPVEADLRRESQVIRQVRESDMDLEPRISATTTALSSPMLGAVDDVSDMPAVPDDMMMTDSVPGGGGGGGSSTFKQQAVRNSKGSKAFWDTFSECSSLGGGARTTPPPQGPGNANVLSRACSTAPFSQEDVNMDSPIPAAKDAFLQSQQSSSMSGMVTGGTGSQSDSQQSGTPQMMMPGAPYSSSGMMIPPTVAEITRRINSKRRRDDDFDPVSFKRRAVSPGMSVHNSPVTQSPLQRDVAPWGSRPGSNGGDRGGSSAPSETGSLEKDRGNGGGGNGGGGGAGNRLMKRVGFQGMVDTNDGLMRMSIE